MSLLPYRKRVNNSLDQLRTLLPQTVHIRKDMASMLEQTVEYINIMHTVLNEEKPACLTRVYQAYQVKTEEMENFRKSVKQIKKQKEPPASSSRNPVNVMKTPAPVPLDGEPFPKLLCPNSYHEQFHNHNWQPHRRFDSLVHHQQHFGGADASFFYQPNARPMYQYPTHSQQCMDYLYNFDPNHNRMMRGNNPKYIDASQDEQHHKNEPEHQIPSATENSESQTESTPSSSQVTSDETSNSSVSQNSNCDIEAAAIATGILNENSCATSLKQDETRPFETFYHPNKCNQLGNSQPYGIYEPWFSSASLPTMTLSQATYTTCDLQASAVCSVNSREKPQDYSASQ